MPGCSRCPWRITLAVSCEDIVERGPTPEHLEAMKQALANDGGGFVVFGMPGGNRPPVWVK